MSDLFNIYEDNLNITIDRIKKIIETFNNLSKEKAEYAIKDANNCIKEADKLIKQMDIEISSHSTKTGSNLAMKVKHIIIIYLIQLRSYTNEFDSVKKQFLRYQEKYINKKSEEALILGSEDNREGDTGGQQKHKLIENEESAWRQNEKLERAKRSAIEIEGVSVQVMRQLDYQTNQMKDVQRKVGDMNTSIDQSDNLLTKMGKTQNRNKVIILGVVIILIIILVFVILIKTLK